MKRQFGLLLCLMLPASAEAASCGKEIDRVQAQVDARIGAIARADPGARETRAATLNHQPTPASIAAAERNQPGDAGVERALKALRRARAADHRHDFKACERALSEARAAIAR
jgi:hypothetical protein